MKPFDLEKALAGERVVTRDGRNVNQLTLFKFKDHDYLYGVIEGSNDLSAWNPYSHGAGKHIICDINEIDLFMAPKKVKRWILIHNKEDENGACETSAMYKSKAELLYYHGTPEKVPFQILEIEVDE